MSRLEEIKEEYAKSQLFDTWKRLKYFYKDDQDAFEKVLDNINAQYATECCKASLEKASEDPDVYTEDDAVMALESILKPENIVLL